MGQRSNERQTNTNEAEKILGPYFTQTVQEVVISHQKL